LDYGDYEILVVDNGSSDDSVDMLRKEFPDLRFVSIDNNLGFTGGVNVGLEIALEEDFDYVWLLNNDTIVDKDSLTFLVKAAGDIDKAGLLGSKVYYYSSPKTINYAGGKINRITCRIIHEGDGIIDDGRFDEITEPDFVTGASSLLDVGMLREIGMMDTAYFIYYEDADLSLRARKAGWKVVLVPESVIWHKLAQTTKQSAFSNSYYATRNSLYFCRKHMPYSLPTTFLADLVYHVASHLVKYIFKGFPKEELEKTRMALSGFHDFFFNRMGECAADKRWK
jgi:GT2 family glycosyltransferase